MVRVKYSTAVSALMCCTGRVARLLPSCCAVRSHAREVARAWGNTDTTTWDEQAEYYTAHGGGAGRWDRD